MATKTSNKRKKEMSKLRNFLVSDTHWGHAKTITTFKRKDGSPLRPFKDVDEMNAEMIRRWNEVVGPNDLVYHLGDVAMNKNDLHFIGQCNGRKILIHGNHDTNDTREFLTYFEKVVALKIFKDMMLTHIPVHDSQLQRFGTNVHGHLHAHDLDDPRYLCVCVEHTDYAPISLEEVRLRIAAKQAKYGYTPGKPWGNAAHRA